MRIIPDGIEPHSHSTPHGTDYPHYDVADAIEITDAQLDEIENEYWDYRETNDYKYDTAMSFSQYLKELIKLSLQSSAALTNLMGAFPDLPDEWGEI